MNRPHNDPIGPLGACGFCPVCGRYEGITWDPATEVSSCVVCGWNNELEAEENKNRRKANGEL